MKIFTRIIALTAILLAVVALYINFKGPGKFDAPYPEVRASKDSSVIAYGKYLVYGPAHCATCHVSPDRLAEVEMGMEVPLTGGFELEIPPGRFYAGNLTSDVETGIGALSDAEIARTLRYGVNSEGRYIMPFMEFQNMSDDDLTAIISYLRSVEPVRKEVPKTEFSFLGKALLTFGLVKPVFPKVTPPKSVIRDTSAAYGEYFCSSVANCKGCHTARDLKTGEFTGPFFAGGMVFGPDPTTKNHVFVSPNLTGDKSTSVIANWNEEVFIQRFRAGRMPASSPLVNSPMPWGEFSRIDENDLKAVYKFLTSLNPEKRSVEQTVFVPGEKVVLN